MHDLLKDPLIRIATAEGTRSASLPEVYASLMADSIEAFPSLRPHQRHPLHAFLVQLGVMALQQSGLPEPPAEAETWKKLLRTLTTDWPGDEPWHLVVEDFTRPAFLQPPASSQEKERDYKNEVTTPDDLDVLVTSKNHDLKGKVAAEASENEWLFALITLQTMEGFSGAGNFGISRMNGGFGSRPAFSLTPSTRPGIHARRDISALSAHAASQGEGHRLLWVLPWDGNKSEKLLPSVLAPLYIEVCRRVRLCSGPDRRLYGRRASSKSERIEAKELRGQMGDPWTPVDRKGNKALTLPAGGFTYKRVTDYLTSGDWEAPLLLQSMPEEQRSAATMQVIARAMVRGQGKTEGFHERVIPVRSRFRSAMQRRNSRELNDIGEISGERIKNVGLVQRILSHAIQVYAARGDSDNVSAEHRRLARPWLNKLDEVVDHTFFDDLQAEFEADSAVARNRARNEWLKDVVVENARVILRSAMESLPCPSNHKYRSLVNAEGLFEGRIRGNNGLSFLFNEVEEENT